MSYLVVVLFLIDLYKLVLPRQGGVFQLSDRMLAEYGWKFDGIFKIESIWIEMPDIGSVRNPTTKYQDSGFIVQCPR